MITGKSMIPKPKRTINKELLLEYRSKPCHISDGDCFGDVCAHHLKSRGAGGGDVLSNLLPLCVYHHNLIHKIGTYTFCLKYDIHSNP